MSSSDGKKLACSFNVAVKEGQDQIEQITLEMNDSRSRLTTQLFHDQTISLNQAIIKNFLFLWYTELCKSDRSA